MEINPTYAKRLLKLTNRQLEVLKLLCQGLEYWAIAERLVLSEKTVRVHASNISKKLELHKYRQGERRNILFEIYCPLIELDRADLIKLVGLTSEESIEEEIVEVDIDEFESERELTREMTEEEEEIVDELQYPLVVVGSQAIVDPTEEEENGDSDCWKYIVRILVGLVLIIGVAAGFLLIRNALLSETSDDSIPVETLVAQTLASTLENQPPTPEPPSPSITPVIQTKEVIVVVTATSEPFIPTKTSIPNTPESEIPLPFSDDFDSGLKPEWSILSGDWRIANGRLTTITEDQLVFVVVGNNDWKDYVVEVHFEAHDFTRQPVYILVRFQDIDNYIAFVMELRESYWGIRKDGKWTQLVEGEGSYWHDPDNTSGYLRIEVEGEFFRAYYDNDFWLSINDPSFDSGKVGIATICSNICDSFDNFEVR